MWKWLKRNLWLPVVALFVVAGLAWLRWRNSRATAEFAASRVKALRDEYARIEAEAEESDGFYSERAIEYREKRQDLTQIVETIEAHFDLVEAEVEENSRSLEEDLDALKNVASFDGFRFAEPEDDDENADDDEVDEKKSPG